MRPSYVRARTAHAAIMSAVLALGGGVARGQAADPGFTVHYGVDGAIIGAGLATSFLAPLIPVDPTRRWEHEPFAFDEPVKRNFSASAAGLSDTLLNVAMITPLAVFLGGGANEATGQRALIYVQAMTSSLALNSVTKYLVQRPRPYTYSSDPLIEEEARSQGRDAHLSFYSGHASLSFTAAVAGSTLFMMGSDDREARAVLWGVEVSLASATTSLRPRAGKHFYSDVIAGALMGTGMGLLVPLVHADTRGLKAPSAEEWGAIGGGLLLGTLAGQLVPEGRNVKVHLPKDTSAELVPVALAHGGGLGLSGIF
jgi:membrane-associated phospholipid phosphatase